MKYRFLGNTGVKVSELCLGTMTFAREAGETDCRAILDAFVDAGGNFVDTANVYGRTPGASEEILGKILAGKRDRVFLATKVFGRMGDGPNERGLSRLHIMREVENSLRRLKTDHLDLYYLHNWDHPTRLEDAMKAMDDLTRSGKIIYVGASNFAARHLMRAVCLSQWQGLEKISCFQAQYNLVERNVEKELLPLCREEGIGFVAWGPLGGGFLSGKYSPGAKPEMKTRLIEAGDAQEASWKNKATEKNFEIAGTVKEIAAAKGVSPAQLSLAWLLAQPGVTAPILGARTVQQLKDNLRAVDVELTGDEVEKLHAASANPPEYPYRTYERNVR